MKLSFNSDSLLQFYCLASILSLIIVINLILLLQKLIKKQVSKELDNFSAQAKIPRFIRDKIKIKMTYISKSGKTEM